MKALLFSLLFLPLPSCIKDVSLHSSFPRLKIDPALKNQKINIDKSFQEKNISGKKYKFEGSFRDHQLIVEAIVNVDLERATSLFNSKSMMIKGLYAIMAMPQNGAAPTEENCTTNLQINPQVVDNKIQTSLQFSLMATERLIIGVCNEEQNVFHNQALLLYCKNDKIFYDLRYYYPKSLGFKNSPIASCVK